MPLRHNSAIISQEHNIPLTPCFSMWIQDLSTKERRITQHKWGESMLTWWELLSKGLCQKPIDPRVLWVDE